MNNQQRPTVKHREHCLILGGSLDGRELWGRMDTWISMAESSHCSPGTTTILLISYAPIQNKKFKLKKKKTITNVKKREREKGMYIWVPLTQAIVMPLPLPF